MNYRIIVLIIAVMLIVVTMCEILSAGRKSSAEAAESTEMTMIETTEVTEEPVEETEATTVETEAPTEPTEETVCEATEAPTKPEPTEDVTVPKETVEETTVATEPPEPSEEVETRLYYDVPLDHDLQDHIFDLCEMYDVDPAIIIAMIEKESNYQADAIGDGGASKGLMQIQTKWHQGRMDELGVTDLLDPYQNVHVGIDLFAEVMEMGGNSTSWALMAYNGGPSFAREMRAAGTISYYARRVMQIADGLEFEE